MNKKEWWLEQLKAIGTGLTTTIQFYYNFNKLDVFGNISIANSAYPGNLYMTENLLLSNAKMKFL